MLFWAIPSVFRRCLCLFVRSGELNGTGVMTKWNTENPGAKIHGWKVFFRYNIVISVCMSIIWRGSPEGLQASNFSLQRLILKYALCMCMCFTNIVMSSLNYICLCTQSSGADIFQTCPFWQTLKLTKSLLWNVCTTAQPKNAEKVIDFIIVFGCLQFKRVQT